MKIKYVILLILGFLLNDFSKASATYISDYYIIKPCVHLMNPEYAKCTYSEKNKYLNMLTNILDYNVILQNFYYGK